ncbi:MAG: helix-hairpin-helix domain-containing protein [Deltaproteobacteria bacterium]|nr:helix-hairpin-helix domain-containing protein [Deltaproteobacteria bacterium]
MKEKQKVIVSNYFANDLKPNIAIGVAFIFILLTLVVFYNFTIKAIPKEQILTSNFCNTPVEIEAVMGNLLSCINSIKFYPCKNLYAGARVRINNGTCKITGNMSGHMRLAAGLKLKLNQASKSELELLNGIGPKLAQAIIDERNDGGPFLSINDLSRVRGIGSQKIKQLSNQIEVTKINGKYN